MEAREGYKNTKLGWIPTDWKFCKISDITKEHKQGYYTKEPYTSNGTYLIRITDLENPSINFDKMPKVEIDEKTYSQFRVEKNDFIFARSGAIGRYGIVTSDKKAVFASYLIRFRFNQDLAKNTFIGYFYESKYSIRQILSITQGSSNININANNIKSLNIPLPPLPEQQKIAEILTTVDNKIASIEDRIQQTEQLKKGLMEKLLTEGIGHTEFKDTKIGRIPASWDVAMIGSLFDFYNGYGFYKDGYSKDGILVIDLLNITRVGILQFTEKDKYISRDLYEKRPKQHLNKNDLLIIMTDITPGKLLLGKSAILSIDGEFALNQRVGCLRSKDKTASIPFVRFMLNSDMIHQAFASKALGTAQFYINTPTITDTIIPFPPPSEQKQIASILSTVDDKLDVLQSKKANYKTLKKGLMEQLLTGKMRVKP